MALESIENPLGQIPNSYSIGQVLYNAANTGTAMIQCILDLYPGTYLIKAASGGGASFWVTGYWWNGTRQGGAGGVWEGQIRLDKIARFQADVNPQNGNTGGDMAVYLDGTRLFYIGGGQRGGQDAEAYGGVLTQDAALAQYVAAAGNQVSIAQNGPNGAWDSVSFGSPNLPRNRGVSTMQTGMAEGLYWGMGAGTSSEAGATPGGFFLQRVG